MDQKVLDWINLRPNKHLRNAFLLRKDGQYKEAGKELKLACDEGDGEALYVMYETLLTGGFGIPEAGPLTADVYLEHSKNVGCNWHLFNSSLDYTREEVEKGNIIALLCFGEYEDCLLNMGDAQFQACICSCDYPCFNVNHFEIERKAALQKITYGMQRLVRRYEFGYGCKKNFVKAAKYWIQLNNIRKIQIRLQSGWISLTEQYMYGKWMVFNQDKIQDQSCIDVYKRVYASAQKAVICWLLISKEYICKDIRVYIGKLIWKSRKKNIKKI